MEIIIISYFCNVVPPWLINYIYIYIYIYIYNKIKNQSKSSDVVLVFFKSKSNISWNESKSIKVVQ